MNDYLQKYIGKKIVNYGEYGRDFIFAQNAAEMFSQVTSQDKLFSFIFTCRLRPDHSCEFVDGCCYLYVGMIYEIKITRGINKVVVYISLRDVDIEIDTGM